MSALRPIDPVITFRNSQGEGGRGTLSNLQRRQLVMEIYTPSSIVQISEVSIGSDQIMAFPQLEDR